MCLRFRGCQRRWAWLVELRSGFRGTYFPICCKIVNPMTKDIKWGGLKESLGTPMWINWCSMRACLNDPVYIVSKEAWQLLQYTPRQNCGAHQPTLTLIHLINFAHLMLTERCHGHILFLHNRTSRILPTEHHRPWQLFFSYSIQYQECEVYLAGPM